MLAARNKPLDQMFHTISFFGRSKALHAVDTRTEVERTAWAFKNHVDIYRGQDITFYAPAPEDWYPPTRDELAKRFHMQPGLFDRAIQPELDEDPLVKYTRKAESILRLDKKTKNSELSRQANLLEQNGARRFSVTDELRRIRRLHPTEVAATKGSEQRNIPRLSLIDRYFEGLRGKSLKDSNGDVMILPAVKSGRAAGTANTERYGD